MLTDRQDVIDKLVYTATNPVKDHLVDRVHHRPGGNGLHELLTGRPLRAKRHCTSFDVMVPCRKLSSCGLPSRQSLGRRQIAFAERRHLDRAEACGPVAGAARGRRNPGEPSQGLDTQSKLCGSSWVRCIVAR